MAGKKELRLKKGQIIEKFARATGDTGSPEVQVALLTGRINELNGHFKSNPKDFSSMRGLLQLVSQRKRLLSYLRDSDVTRYQKLIQSLELRK